MRDDEVSDTTGDTISTKGGHQKNYCIAVLM